MAPAICLLQTTGSVDLAKVKAWSKEQKLHFELYDQASLLSSAEAKSPLATRIAAEQKAAPKGQAFLPSVGLLTDLLKRLAGIPLKPPSRPGTATTDATSQNASGPRSVIFCSGIFSTIAAVTEAAQAGLTFQGIAQLIDEDASQLPTTLSSVAATDPSSTTAAAFPSDQLVSDVRSLQKAVHTGPLADMAVLDVPFTLDEEESEVAGATAEQGQDAADTPTDAPLVVEGHAVAAEPDPDAAAAPAAEAEADVEEDEQPAPTGGLELAEAAEKLLAELDAYSQWKASVRIHKLPAEAPQIAQPFAKPASVSSQDGIKEAMQSMLELCDSGLEDLISTPAVRASAISSGQAEAGTTSDPAMDQKLTEAALDTAWQEFKKRLAAPAIQAPADAVHSNAPASATRPGPALSVQTGDVDMRVATGVATGFIPSVAGLPGQVSVPSMQELAARMLPAATEQEALQWRLDASRLEALCQKRGMKREVMQHVQLLQQLCALIIPAPASFMELLPYTWMVPMNPASLQASICQARAIFQEERCTYSRTEDAVLMALSASSQDTAQAKLPTMVSFSTWWKTISGSTSSPPPQDIFEADVATLAMRAGHQQAWHNERTVIASSPSSRLAITSGSCTVAMGHPPAPSVSILLPGSATISVSSQASLVSAPGKPQPPRAVATFQLPDGRTLEVSPTGWVRLFPCRPATSAAPTSNLDDAVAGRLPEMKAFEFLWAAVTPTGSLIQAQRNGQVAALHPDGCSSKLLSQLRPDSAQPGMVSNPLAAWTLTDLEGQQWQPQARTVTPEAKLGDISSAPSAPTPADMLPRGSLSVARASISAGADPAESASDDTASDFGSPGQEIGCAAVTDPDLGARVTMREDLIMKIEYPNGDSLVEDPLGARLTTFTDRKWKVQVAGFAPVSGSALEGKLDIVPGLQARILHEQQALICSSNQLGQLVVIGNLVVYQPPASSSSPPSVSLEKMLQIASKANQEAEAAYNKGVIQWEQEPAKPETDRPTRVESIAEAVAAECPGWYCFDTAQGFAVFKHGESSICKASMAGLEGWPEPPMLGREQKPKPQLFLIRRDGSGFELLAKERAKAIAAERQGGRVTKTSSDVGNGLTSTCFFERHQLTEPEVPSLPLASPCTLKPSLPIRTLPTLKQPSAFKAAPHDQGFVLPRMAICQPSERRLTKLQTVYTYQQLVEMPEFTRETVEAASIILKEASTATAARTSNSGFQAQPDTRTLSEKQKAAAISARIQELLEASASTNNLEKEETAHQQGQEEANAIPPSAAFKAKHPWTKKVRPFSELPQRPNHGMLNFWQTKEGLHAIETDATLRPPSIEPQEDPLEQKTLADALPEAVDEPTAAGPDLDASALPVMVEAGA
ncbi:hypothetical protein WJX74_009024 [Apatococcus lobatus]|uniref:Uncharacterized protein n=1 Tax=Apatococcus lobatus TaxID=904363 RepID=A0AAW1RTZ6_9CHLO